MKKTLVALAVLGSFAGVASAATSVTLYGTVDAGYEGWSYGKDFSSLNNTFVQGSGSGPITGSKTGTSESNSKIGVKGQEDLGNGLAATFQLEGDVNADVGSSNLFNRESTVGLKGAFGEVKVGRSKSQMELALGGVVPGRRVADVDLYSVAAKRHSNGLFYSYDNAGFSFGADVTTKGGALGDDHEGEKGQKVGWGVRAGYAGNVGGNVTLLARAAYQRDGVVLPNDKQQYEAGGLLAAVIPYSNNALTVGVAYAQGRGEAKDLVTAKFDATPFNTTVDKARTWSGVVASTFGPNDSAYVKYQQRKGKLEDGSVAYNGNVWAIGYEHALSKRTSVYADVAYATIKKPTPTVADKGTATGYSVGLSHSF
ncbi:MAG: porin [Burkholderiaceae bacterium]